MGYSTSDLGFEEVEVFLEFSHAQNITGTYGAKH